MEGLEPDRRNAGGGSLGTSSDRIAFYSKMNIVRKVLEQRKAAFAASIIVLLRQLHREPAHMWIVERIVLQDFRSVLQNDQQFGGTLERLSAMGVSA